MALAWLLGRSSPVEKAWNDCHYYMVNFTKKKHNDITTTALQKLEEMVQKPMKACETGGRDAQAECANEMAKKNMITTVADCLRLLNEVWAVKLEYHPYILSIKWHIYWNLLIGTYYVGETLRSQLVDADISRLVGCDLVSFHYSYQSTAYKDTVSNFMLHWVPVLL